MPALQLHEDQRRPIELDILVQNFGRDTVLHRQLIREVMENDPGGFLASAIEILKFDRESRGVQYLLSLLVSQNLLFEALCDPGLDREQAVTLARSALRVDPMVDVTLARRLAEVAVSDPGASGLGDVGRVLEILGDLSDGTRILPSLMRLLRNANPYLRSKAVLMVGRGSKSARWVKRRLAESDPRVRANAVEAIWGVDTAESRELLQFAAHDSSNRVAGNALMGLYWLGDSESIGELVKMAGHVSAGFRMSAAWAMGETGDPRFTEVLGRMLSDSNSGVRKRAFAAVAQIKTAVARVAQTVKWDLVAVLGRKDRPKAPRRISVTVRADDMRERPAILPTQFILTEDGQPVLSYRVVEKPVPEGMSLVFFLPRIAAAGATYWVEAALRCLSWKRPTDLWCAVPYLPEGDIETEQGAIELPPYTSQPAVIEAALTAVPNRAQCTDLWSSLWRAVTPENGPHRGKRHLIVFAPAGVERVAGHGLVAAVLSSRTSVHVISEEANEALENFCGQTGGSLQIARSPAEIEQVAARIYLGLLAQYDISYHPINDSAASVKVRVHCADGYGEDIVSIPRL